MPISERRTTATDPDAPASWHRPAVDPTAALFGVNQVPVHGQPTPVPISDSVIAAAGQGQLVPIIVGARVDGYRPEGDLIGPAAAVQRRGDQVVGFRSEMTRRIISASNRSGETSPRDRALGMACAATAAAQAVTITQTDGGPRGRELQVSKRWVPLLLDCAMHRRLPPDFQR